MLEEAQYEQHMREYLLALASGDGAGVASRLADNVVWHVGGSHPLSGTYASRDVVAQTLLKFKERSGGTVRLVPGEPMFNGDLAAVQLQFSAHRPGKFMSMQGIDVFRLGPGGIEEVWLFSTDQQAEDDFWGD
jgi:ketosteroid isomerase-like protein